MSGLEGDEGYSPGVALTEKRERFVRLIGEGVSNSEACPIVGANRGCCSKRLGVWGAGCRLGRRQRRQGSQMAGRRGDYPNRRRHLPTSVEHRTPNCPQQIPIQLN